MHGRVSRGVHDFAVGDKVQLSGKYLRSTGQIKGPEGRKVWTIREIQGDLAVVNEKTDTGWYTAEELAADPSLHWRRINLGNLVRVGTLSSRNSP